MKRKLTKRVLALLAALAMIFSLLPMTAMAATETYYEKVTTPEAGKNYLIVYANGNSGFALKNNSGSVGSVPVSIDNNEIKLDDAGAVWTVSGSTDLQFTNSGQKIGGSYTTLKIASSFNFPDSAEWRYSGTTLTNRGAGEYKLACNNSGTFSLAYNGSAISFYEQKEREIAPTTYAISIDAGQGGTVTADKATAAEGETVTLTVTPDSGYELNEFYAQSGGTVIDIQAFQFTMPAGDVTVVATFLEVQPPQDPVAKIGDNYYDTLQDAVLAAGPGDTITVLKNIEGDGLYIPAGKFADIEVTIDLNGFDYDITGTGVGTDQNIGILIESGNKVKFTDVNSNSGGNIRGNVSLETVLQSSGELTLNDVLVYSNKEQPADTDKALYVSGGSVTLEHAAVVARSSTVGYALYVAPAASADVTADTNSYTDGKVRIEVPQGGNPDHLNMTLNNQLVRGSDIFEVDPSIDNVMDKVNVTKAAGTNYVIDRDADYEWENDTTLALKTSQDAVAQINNDTTYPSLEAALAAAQDGDQIKLLKDSSGNGLYVAPDRFATGLTINFNEHTYSITGTGVGTNQDTGIFIGNGNEVVFTTPYIGNANITNEGSTNRLDALIRSYGDLTMTNIYAIPNSDTQMTLGVYGGYTTLNNSIILPPTYMDEGRPKPVAGSYALYINSDDSVFVSFNGEHAAIGGDIGLAAGANLQNLTLVLNDYQAFVPTIRIDQSIDAVMNYVHVTKPANKDMFLIDRDTVYEWKNDTTLALIEQPPVVETKTYKKVTTLTAGKNYLIASGDSGEVFLLNHVDDTISKVSAVVENGKITLNDATCEWVVGGTPDSSFTLANNNAYLVGNGTNLHVQAAANNWVWTGTELGDGNNGYFHLRYFNDKFVSTAYEQGSKVFFFEEYEPEPEFVGHSLVLTDQIGVRFYMDLSCLSAEEIANSSLTFELNQMEDLTIPASDATVEDGKYVFTCPTNSLQMADTITATFTYREDKEVVDEYSVKAYIEYVVGNTSEFQQTVVDLAKAIADYGQYAQAYLKDAHGFTVGEGGKYAEMTGYKAAADLDIAGAAAATEQYKAIPVLDGSQVEKLQLKLSLDTKTALSIRAKVPAGVTVTGTAFFVDTDFEFDENAVAKVTGIRASLLDDDAYINGNAGGRFGGTACALSYANAVLSSTSASTLQKNAMAALYNYYAAVLAYRSN